MTIRARRLVRWLLPLLFAGACASSPSSPEEPAVSLAGTWSGTASDSSGSGRMTWQLTQSGSSVSGTITSVDSSGPSGRGTVSGTLGGSSLQFTITVSAGGFDAPYDACATTVSGTASVTSTAISGTYTGSSTGSSVCSVIGTGQFTLDKQ